MFNGTTRYQWPCSVTNYQRVDGEPPSKTDFGLVSLSLPQMSKIPLKREQHVNVNFFIAQPGKGEDIIGISLDMMGFADNHVMNEQVQGDLLVEGSFQ